MVEPVARPPDHEMRLIAAFFGPRHGYFVEVGANDPRDATAQLEVQNLLATLLSDRSAIAVETLDKANAA
jgi:hypothetical protein